MASSSRQFPPSVTESPEMKFARNRLGDLLHGIRNYSEDSKDMSRDEEMFPDDPFEFDEEAKKRKSAAKRKLIPTVKGPESSSGSGRRPKRDKRIVFELRGKPFELGDKLGEQNIFQLCRVWIKGRDDVDTKSEPNEPYPIPTEDSLDLLATKEIYALPKPKMIVTDPVPLWPEPEKMETRREAEVADMDKQAILNTYLPHWKRVKKKWLEHSKSMQTPYAKSMCLLETVYNIAQQNQLMH